MNRRGVRLAVLAAVVVVAVTAVGLAVLPEIVRRVVVWRVGAATGRVVTLDAVELGLFRGHVMARGLRVLDRDASPLATLDRLDVRFSPRDLLRLRVRLLDVTIDAPTIRLVRTGPRQFNVSDLLGGPKKEGGGTTLRLTVERAQLRGGAVVVEDRTATPPRTVRIDAAATVRDASTQADRPAGSASLEATVDGAPLTVSITDLRLAPLQLRAVVKAERIPAALAALVLPPEGPLGPPGGTLTVSATIDHEPASGTRVAGDIALTGLELRRAGEARAFVAAPAVRVTLEGLRVRQGGIDVGRVALDGGSITLEDSTLGRAQRWKVDGVAFEARELSSSRDAPPGTATARATMAGAQLSAWAAQVRLAPLELHATTIIRNADLSVLRVYLPATLPVQPERGIVDATVRVDHDATRGTRLGVDASLGTLELRRPGHFVTAPAVRLTADNVALGGGGVTVGHATVTGARLTVEERSVTPARTWVVQNLVVDAKDLSSRPGAVQGVASVQATVAGANVTAFLTQARLDPLELHATANVRNLDLALVRLFLPPDTPIEPGRGVVNAGVQIDHTVAAGTRVVGDATVTGLQARGRGAFATLTLTAPTLRVTLTDARRQRETVSIARMEVSGSGSLVDGRDATSRIDFAQLRAATEGLTWPVSAPARVEVSARFGDRSELDARGTAALTAPLPKIAWTLDLALAFRRVDLAPLAVYVPAARGFGGRIQANVTANVAYDGRLTARVRGDVAGGRFALAEGGRTLVSLRRIDLKGLDAQWPERIAIEQVRLRQPFALVERDAQGRILLLDRVTPPTGAEATPAPATGEVKPRVLPLTIGEVVVEDGTAAVIYTTRRGRALRTDIPRVTATVRNVTWPSTAPARLAVDVALADGGSVKLEGTAEGQPATVDLKVVLAKAELATISPWLPFRARLRGKVDGTLTVAGTLAPQRLTVRGDAGLRSLVVADGRTPLITVETIDAAGIDAVWPERVTMDRVRVRRSWALLERDRQGTFRLQTLFVQTPESAAPAPAGSPAPSAPPATPAPPPARVELTVRELVLEQQSATIVDALPTPPAKFDVTDARLTARDFTWPPRGPMKIDLASPMPGGGRLTASGTFELAPVRIDIRVGLDAVSIAPAQSYLPIEGKVAGQMTGEVALKLALEPLSVQATGKTELRRFQLNDGDRPVVTVGRVDVGGIDVDWPRRIGVERVQMRRPRLLVERDALGDIRLWRVVTPRWNAPAPAEGAVSPAARADTTPASPAAAPPVIEVGTFHLERASARFVDQSTTPTFAEELSNVEMTVTPLTTAPGGRTRFTGTGAVGGGSFKVSGDVTTGERNRVALTVEVRDYVVARANPYLDLYTGWTATRGSLTIKGTYTLDGTRLETRHEVVGRGLDVQAVDTRDEVERRVGLPFGLLLSLLKDSRGVVSLSVPVAGDLATRTFDFQDALWSAVKSLAVRLVALPFSKIGSLFVSQDSKVESVAIAPVTFEPGTDRLAAGMDAHLQKIAGFLRDTPAVSLGLQAIFTQADADALKAQADPSEALHKLGEQRLAAVREVFARAGVDAARLTGRVPRRPLIESAGTSRVELSPRSGA